MHEVGITKMAVLDYEPVRAQNNEYLCNKVSSSLRYYVLYCDIELISVKKKLAYIKI